MSKLIKNFFSDSNTNSEIEVIAMERFEESFLEGERIINELDNNLRLADSLAPALESLVTVLTIASNDNIDFVLTKEGKNKVTMESLGVSDVPASHISAELKMRAGTMIRNSIETIITQELGMSLEDYHQIVMESREDNRKSILAAIWEKIKEWVKKAFIKFYELFRKAFGFTVSRLRRLDNAINEFNRISRYSSHFPGKDYKLTVKHRVLTFMPPIVGSTFDDSVDVNMTTFLQALDKMATGIEHIEKYIKKMFRFVEKEISIVDSLVLLVLRAKSYEEALEEYIFYTTRLNNHYQKEIRHFFSAPVSKEVAETVGHGVTHSVSFAYAQDNKHGYYAGPYAVLNEESDADDAINSLSLEDLSAIYEIPKLMNKAYELYLFRGSRGAGSLSFTVEGVKEKFHDDSLDFLKALEKINKAFHSLSKSASEAVVAIPELTTRLVEGADIKYVKWEVTRAGKELIESAFDIARIACRNGLAFVANASNQILPEISTTIVNLEKTLKEMGESGGINAEPNQNT